MKLEYLDCRLKINDIEMVVEHPIAVAISDGERAFIIFDYSDFPPQFRPNNLVCFDGAGHEAWCGENPVQLGSSAYTNFVSVSPHLVVGNFAGYDVTLNKETGKVLDLKFLK